MASSTGQGWEGQCKAVQGQAKYGGARLWVDHGRIGRVGCDQAGSVQGRSWSDSVGQGQHEAEWNRIAPDRTRQAGKNRTGP